jgi:hypothetical protein
MKKPSYPTPGEIEKIIAETERRGALREQLKQQNRELKIAQAELRRALCEQLYTVDNPNKPLAYYLGFYNKAGAKNGDINAQIAAADALSKSYDAVSAELKEGETEFRTRVLEICARAEGMKRLEYEALIAKVAAVLQPYCAGDEHAAQQLAADTPAAAEIKMQRERCYPSTYGSENLATPLRAALEFSTANNAAK